MSWDLLSDLGLSPEDRAFVSANAPSSARFVAAHNETNEWGVWDRTREVWAVFPVGSWVGPDGERAAEQTAADEEYAAS